MDGRERRARLARRHHLAAGAQAASAEEVAQSLVAVHATDAASVFLGCLARIPEGGSGGDGGAGGGLVEGTRSIERALYEDRSLIRLLGMRRTVFVVPAATAPIIHAGCTRAIAVQERRKLVQLVEQADIAADGAAWLELVEAQTLAALRERGEALGQELGQAVPALQAQYSFGDETKKWAGAAAIGTRVLFVMAADGRIVRGRPRGTWISSQHRWAPRDAWPTWPDGGAELPVDLAQAELARLWLAVYGPGTAADLKWWTGWTMGETRRALARIGPVEVDLGAPDAGAGPGAGGGSGAGGAGGGAGAVAGAGAGGPGFVLAGDEAPVAGSPGEPEPWAALLPALDSTVMGWAGREWFLGDQRQRAPLFDRSGNAGPTVWWDGQVVGGWAQRKDGEIAIRLLRDIGADGTAAIAGGAERLRRAIGAVRVTPRFRTPLEQELVR